MCLSDPQKLSSAIILRQTGQLSIHLWKSTERWVFLLFVPPVGQHLHNGSPQQQFKEQLKEPTCLLLSATEFKQGQPPLLHLSGPVQLSSDFSHLSSTSLVHLVAVVKVTVGGAFASRGINVSHQQEICQQLGPLDSLTVDRFQAA
ncbi:rCG57253 [Rattus norvegicus]|uniref:RCG57253 n=1 Tax=Rattus norvegicus TaxID=10116 RepID=A6KPK1_RAT|nr:rCG57253 [Rattus norvegicus]